MAGAAVGFESWWCTENADERLLDSVTLQEQSELLLPSCCTALSSWSKYLRLEKELLSTGQPQETIQARLNALLPRNHASRHRRFGDHAQPVPLLWQHPTDSVVRAVATKVRSILRQAWWPGIGPEFQTTLDGGTAIDFLHEDCPVFQLTQVQLQEKRRIFAPSGWHIGAHYTALISATLSTNCMPINQPGIHGDLPGGCSTHSPLGAMGQSTLPLPTQQTYLRLQLASKIRDNAHRWIAWLRFGPPTVADMEAVHLCNNKNCLNPYHICWVGGCLHFKIL